MLIFKCRCHFYISVCCLSVSSLVHIYISVRDSSNFESYVPSFYILKTLFKKQKTAHIISSKMCIKILPSGKFVKKYRDLITYDLYKLHNPQNILIHIPEKASARYYQKNK